MEVTGTIKKIGETKTVGEKGFKKRNLVLTTKEEYPQDLLLEFVQDKCGLLDSFTVGQQTTVAINLRGREWTNPEGQVKYFNTIQGWRISSVGEIGQGEGVTKVEAEIPAVTDDLPF